MSFIKKHKIASSVGLILLVIATVAITTSGSSNIETIQITKGDLIRTVELSGKVIPSEYADLAFELGGTVSAVYKKVGDKVSSGDILVSLDQSGVSADLLKAEADLAIAEAELAKLSGGKDLQAKITNSKTSVIQDILDAYTNANDAIFNKVDQFFENPRTQNPKITYAFEDLALRDAINANRIVVGEVLAKWKELTSRLTVDTYTNSDTAVSQSYLRTVAMFLDNVSLAVNSFKANALLNQATIDKYRSDVSSARSNINTSATTLIAGEKGLTDNVSDLPVLSARVAGAQASVANIKVKLSKMVLRSPLSGIVSKQDAKIGEAIAPNTVATAVISPQYKIEAFVPEVSISGVVLGAKAKVSLDAYGKDVVFDAVITHIEPRETIRDGVSTYKTDLAFVLNDPRIRSGMTSNISIETLRKDQVLFIPSRAIKTLDGVKTVLVKKEKGPAEQRVIGVGMLDSKGNTEIVSGLLENETVLLNPVP